MRQNVRNGNEMKVCILNGKFSKPFLPYTPVGPQNTGSRHLLLSGGNLEDSSVIKLPADIDHWISPKKMAGSPPDCCTAKPTSQKAPPSTQNLSPNFQCFPCLFIYVLFSASLLNIIRQPKPIRHLREAANGTNRA